MNLDFASAFENGRTGFSVFKTHQGYQVNVRQKDGSHRVFIAPSLKEALHGTFGYQTDDEELL